MGKRVVTKIMIKFLISCINVSRTSNNKKNIQNIKQSFKFQVVSIKIQNLYIITIGVAERKKNTVCYGNYVILRKFFYVLQMLNETLLDWYYKTAFLF